MQHISNAWRGKLIVGRSCTTNLCAYIAFHAFVHRLGKVCSHVAALLFKIEAACKLGYAKPSCTSLPCEWNKSFVDNVRSSTG